jgi:hypothetical protein
VLVPEPVSDVGLKLAVAFVGNPLALSEVAPLNPDVAVSVMVAVPFVPPAVTVTLPELETVKPAVNVSPAEMV